MVSRNHDFVNGRVVENPFSKTLDILKRSIVVAKVASVDKDIRGNDIFSGDVIMKGMSVTEANKPHMIRRPGTR